MRAHWPGAAYGCTAIVKRKRFFAPDAPDVPEMAQGGTLEALEALRDDRVIICRIGPDSLGPGCSRTAPTQQGGC